MTTYTPKQKKYFKTGILIVSLISLYFYYVSCTGHKKHKDDNILIWSSQRKLNVSDYKAFDKKDLPSKYTAGGFMGIQQYFYVDNDTLIYSVKAFLNRDSTFWRFRDIAITRLSDSELNQRYAEVLKHEQVHFDICEIYARKIREKVCECIGINDTDNLRDSVANLKDELFEIQRAYDEVTHHSLVDSEQCKWNLMAEQYLQVLKKYEAADGKILLKRNDEAETGDSVTFQKLASPKK